MDVIDIYMLLLRGKECFVLRMNCPVEYLFFPEVICFCFRVTGAVRQIKMMLFRVSLTGGKYACAVFIQRSF